MRILHYGDSRPGSGGWCYTETLKSLGHEVRIVPETLALESYRTSFFKKVLRKLNGGLLEWDRRRHSSLVIAEARQFQPDIAIIQKGLFLAREEVQELRAGGVWVCNINHDDFFSHNRNNWSPIQRRAISAYDYIFVTRAVNVEEVRPLNPNVEYFPFSYYPEIHKPTPIPESEAHRWKVDLVFVGTHEKSRAAAMEAMMRSGHHQLAIYGSGWQRLGRGSVLRPYVRHGDIGFADLCKALGGAKICLGFLRKENRDEYTQRSFEIPACRGLLLAERTPTHSRLYCEGIEAEFFDVDDPRELQIKVNDLLSNPGKREAMVDAGYEAVLRGRHTYSDRLSGLFAAHQRHLKQRQKG